MRNALSRAETVLLAGLAGLLVLVLAGPAVHQPGSYHHFADQRALWQLPTALDVLSNLPFALAGIIGWIVLWRMPSRALGHVERGMVALFFTGLLLTAFASAWYHLAPDEAGLAIDRSAMAVAFAGLLGLAAASRVSERAGAWLGLTVLLLGPVAARIAFATGNVLPWAVLQFGGMAVVVVLALWPARAGALPLPLVAVLAAYALAKLLEVNDQAVFDLTGQWVSGHTLKHVVAAFAAVPVISALRKSAESRQNAAGVTTTRPAGSPRVGHA